VEEDRPFNIQAELQDLIEQCDYEAKDACNQSNRNFTSESRYYYRGVDSALTGVLGRLGSLLTKVVINKSEG
jgi:hypothetical protein